MKHFRLVSVLVAGALLLAACGSLQEAGAPGAQAEPAAIITPTPSDGMPLAPELLTGAHWENHAANTYGEVWVCWPNAAAVSAAGVLTASVPTPPAPDIEWRLVVVAVGESAFLFHSPKTGDTLAWGAGAADGVVVCKGNYQFEVAITKVDGHGEPLGGVTFNLTGPGDYDESCITDAAGACGFEGLLLGEYTLAEEDLAGYTLGGVWLNGEPLAGGLPHVFELALGDDLVPFTTFAFMVENRRDDGGEWCSPGFWRNSPIAASEAAAAGGFTLDDLYLDFFDELEGINERQRVRLGLPLSPTLMQVLQSPQVYGGAAFNNVGDLLSEAHPDVAFDGERVEDSCPLPADASRKS